MKATQYISGKESFFTEKPLYPAKWMTWATHLSRGAAREADFKGFGVALTGSSCYELSLMEPAAREAFLRDIYTDEGLGLSVARLTIGASDYSAELYSYDDVEDDVSLSCFSIERDRAYIIPMIREVLHVNPDLYLFASPWTPPAWMKTGGSLCGGYMRAEYAECYAEYIVRWLKAYEAEGIRVRAVTPQNEPETQEHGQMPACDFPPEVEAAFVTALRRKLNENKMDVEIWLYDHNFDNAARVEWMLRHCKGLAEAADGVAFHYYRGAIEDTLPLVRAYPQLAFHFTEGGPRLYDNYGTDWCKWAIMMLKTLNAGYRSFTGWNLMLDETGGPNIGPFSCGGLVTRHSVTGALSYSGQYRAFRHVAPFLRKGARVCKVVSDRSDTGMYNFPSKETPLAAACFENADGSVTYLLVNAGSAKKQVEITERGETFYAELLPDTVSTVIIQ